MLHSSQEVGKTIMKSSDAERKKHIDDRIKNSEGAKSQSGSSARASVV